MHLSENLKLSCSYGYNHGLSAFLKNPINLNKSPNKMHVYLLTIISTLSALVSYQGTLKPLINTIILNIIRV